MVGESSEPYLSRGAGSDQLYFCRFRVLLRHRWYSASCSASAVGDRCLIGVVQGLLLCRVTHRLELAGFCDEALDSESRDTSGRQTAHCERLRWLASILGVWRASSLPTDCPSSPWAPSVRSGRSPMRCRGRDSFPLGADHHLHGEIPAPVALRARRATGCRHHLGLVRGRFAVVRTTETGEKGQKTARRTDG